MNDLDASNAMGATLSQLFHRPEARNALPPPPASGEDIRGRGDGAGLQGISKNARKRTAREQRLQERKQARKAQRKAEQIRKKQKRKQEREEMMKSLPVEEREKIISERIKAMRAGRAEDREKRSQIRDVLENGTRYAVCIDLGWNEHMFEKERKSLARQLAYSYSALRKSVEDDMTPLAMTITGVDDIMKPVMTFVAQGWESWPVLLTEKSLEEQYDPEKLVYLTHDSDEVLEALDPDVIYVIGGIVDRNRLRCATVDKARRQGIRTARLNLDANISLQHGTPVLTVNHCVEILIYVANGKSWKEAYTNVLPVRKGIKTSD